MDLSVGFHNQHYFLSDCWLVSFRVIKLVIPLFRLKNKYLKKGLRNVLHPDMLFIKYLE
jgi:hypothetical protein